MDKVRGDWARFAGDAGLDLKTIVARIHDGSGCSLANGRLQRGLPWCHMLTTPIRGLCERSEAEGEGGRGIRGG